MPNITTAAAILVNTASLSLVFNVTFLICITFNLPLWLAFTVNTLVALSSIFRVYKVGMEFWGTHEDILEVIECLKP